MERASSSCRCGRITPANQRQGAASSRDFSPFLARRREPAKLVCVASQPVRSSIVLLVAVRCCEQRWTLLAVPSSAEVTLSASNACRRSLWDLLCYSDAPTDPGIVRSAAQPRFVTEQQSGRSPSLSPPVPSSATIVVDTEGRASSSLLFGGGLTTANHNHSPSLRKGFGSPQAGQYRLQHSQQAGTPNGNHAHPGRANPSPPSQLNINNGQIYNSSSQLQQQQQQAPTSSAIISSSSLHSSNNNNSNNGHYQNRDSNSQATTGSNNHVAPRNGPGLRWSQHATGAQVGGTGTNQVSNQSSFVTNGVSSNSAGNNTSIGSSSSNSGLSSNAFNNLSNSLSNNNNSLSSGGGLGGGGGSGSNASNPRSSSNSSPTGGLIGAVANGGGGLSGLGASLGGSGGPGTPRFKPGLSSLVGHDQDSNLVFRKVRGILNKLTPENFDKLSRDLLNVGLDSTQVLKGVILLIFEKALDEAKYSLMYASLCKTLCEHAPNFDPPPANTFRKLLLAKCQDEFDNRKRALQDAPANSEQRTIAKQKMLGNMRLIGELGKLGLLHEKILHECLHTLLRGKRQEDVDLECLCHMVRTVGARLDTPKGRPLVDQYFERMVKLYSQEGLSARIKFMLQDVCELRRDGWMPRRRAIGNLQQPTTLAHIRNQVMPPPPPHVRHGQSSLQGHHGGPGQDHSLHGRGPHGPHRHRDSGMNPLGNPHDDIFNTPVTSLKKSMVSTTGPTANDSYFDLFDSKPSSIMGTPGRDNRDRDNRSGHGRFSGHSGIHNGHHNNHRDGTGHRDGPFNNHNGPRNNNQGGNVGLHIPARLLKKPLPQQVEEMSLRPHAAPSLLKPKVMPPPGAQLLGSNPLSSLSHSLSAHSSTSTLQAVSVKPTVAAAPLPVKTEAKPRAAKAEFLEKVQRILADHKSNVAMACDEFSKLDIPRKFMNEILVAVSQDVMKEEDPKSIDVLEQLISRFASSGAADTLAPVMRKLPATERAGQLAAELVARLLHSGTLDLADVVQWTDVAKASDDSGAPWILTVLQLLLAREGEQALAGRCRPVSLLSHLPPAARSKDELAALLERHGLACLHPLSVRLERQIAACLPSVEELQVFLEGLDESTRRSPEFVLALVTAALRSASSHSTEAAAELAALRTLCPQLRCYCAKRQGMWALYAAQELWATMGCPRGVLLRWFNLLYEEDIVEEAEFMRWKEDVEHANMFACKGQALFQLNSWLTWLQEAEDEEEDDADE